MTAKVLSFPHRAFDAALSPVDGPERATAADVVARHGVFGALLVVRLVLEAVAPRVAAHTADPDAGCRDRRRLETAERGVLLTVCRLVQRARR